jgi:hypothetical protein
MNRTISIFVFNELDTWFYITRKTTSLYKFGIAEIFNLSTLCGKLYKIIYMMS